MSEFKKQRLCEQFQYCQTDTHYIIEWQLPEHGTAWDRRGVEDEYTERQIFSAVDSLRVHFPGQKFRAVKVTVRHEVIDY